MVVCILVAECAVRKGLLVAAAVAIAGVSFWFLGRPVGAPAERAAAPGESPASAIVPAKASIPYSEARSILEAHRDQLPAALKGKTASEQESAWPAWATAHDAAIRARLAQGDEDSVVNLWLYGTTFTTVPRATEQEIASLASRADAEELLLRRLDDLVAGMASPGANERLQFARQLVARQGIDPATEAGQQQARIYLVKVRERVIAELARYRRAAESARRPGNRGGELNAYSTIYSDRGLSSDTRLTADFALDKALEAIAAKGTLRAQSVRRVAIVGPGLDFTDKAEGFDFYPQQTIQPFALVDSLGRFNLGQPDEVRVTTLDLSPRVNGHLESARARAFRREPYVVQLPLTKDDPKHQWHPDLVAYWQRFGDRIGVEAAPYPAPAVSVRMRAVSVRPLVTLSIAPQDLNIIVQRLEPLPDAEQFDMIVATNILVYYDAFDQALALANISKMLRPGGYFVTNYAVKPVPPLEPSASIVTSVFFDKQGNGDTLFCYQRR
jgi:SAM-dependent methyltransferase